MSILGVTVGAELLGLSGIVGEVLLWEPWASEIERFVNAFINDDWSISCVLGLVLIPSFSLVTTEPIHCAIVASITVLGAAYFLCLVVFLLYAMQMLVVCASWQLWWRSYAWVLVWYGSCQVRTPRRLLQRLASAQALLIGPPAGSVLHDRQDEDTSGM